jgi:uncharacterized membrane protein (DUF485 family)
MANPQTPDWETLAQLPAFHELLAAKRRFIIPATIFFLAYYMALPVLIGYFPELMKKPLFGKVNGAYAFAFSQFLMTFLLAAFYMRTAKKWDAMEHDLLASIESKNA